MYICVISLLDFKQKKMELRRIIVVWRQQDLSFLGIFAAVFFSNVMLIPSPRVFIPFHLRKKRPRGGLIRDIPQCKSHEIASCAHVHTSSMNLGGNAVIWTLPYVHMT